MRVDVTGQADECIRPIIGGEYRAGVGVIRARCDCRIIDHRRQRAGGVGTTIAPSLGLRYRAETQRVPRCGGATGDTSATSDTAVRV